MDYSYVHAAIHTIIVKVKAQDFATQNARTWGSISAYSNSSPQT